MRHPRRSLLLSATALALVFATPAALATTTVSTATTTPLQTATANSGTNDDIDVTDAATITLTSGTALTVNSNNTLILNGVIEMSASESSATGVLIDGARTTSLDLSGTITVTDSYTAEDKNSDDIVDGVFAEGTNRYGVRATGLLTGDADIDSTITVHGNQSAAILFEKGQVGDFLFDGTISVLGDDARGIALRGSQTGQVYLSGSIYTQGKDAQAVELSGAINGALVIDASVTNTGYRYTSISEDYLDLLDADDLYQARAAVQVSNTVSGGVLINAAVTSEDDTNTDENGNGITDTEEGTASIAQYGTAPALLIGSDTQAITLGAVAYNDTATDDYSGRTYGLDIRGSVAAHGVYEGVNATAVQIAGLGYDVNVTNGIGLSGSVSASANEATATGLALKSGAQVGTLNLSGTLSANTTTTDSHAAYGLDISSGATLSTLKIETGGALTAYGYGTTANATALRDTSNTLTSLVINGSISAGITPGDEDEDDVSDTAVNREVAIDLSANSVGTTIEVVNAHLDDDDYAQPYITGDIKLGSGNDTVRVSNGYIYGNIDFGAGSNSLRIEEEGVVLGKLTGAGTVAVDVANGRLGLSAGSQLTLSSLHVGSESELYLGLSTADPTRPLLINTGTTVFDDGAALYLTLDKIIQTPTRFTLMTGKNIDFGTLDFADMDEQVPWLYKSTLTTGSGNDGLYADFRLRTQSESGLSVTEYSALGAVLTAAATDDDTTSTLLAATTESGFVSTYAAFLPDFSGETLLSLSRGREALTRSIEKQSILPGMGETHYWLQEEGYQLNRERGQTLGFKTTGFSFGGGIERGLGYGQAVGLFTSYTAATPKDTYATAYETSSAADFTLGGYWRLESGGLKAWLSAGVGGTFFETERQMVGSANTLTARAKWNGYSLSGSTGASYRATLGPISIKPLVSIDYYALKEDARNESGGGSAFDLSIDERQSHIATAYALLSLGRGDRTALLQPEFWVGYRNNVSVKVDDTVARFTGGDAFTLSAGDVKGGAPVIGMRMMAGNEYGYVALEAEGEKYSEYRNYKLSLRTGFKF